MTSPMHHQKDPIASFHICLHLMQQWNEAMAIRRVNRHYHGNGNNTNNNSLLQDNHHEAASGTKLTTGPGPLSMQSNDNSGINSRRNLANGAIVMSSRGGGGINNNNNNNRKKFHLPRHPLDSPFSAKTVSQGGTTTTTPATNNIISASASAAAAGGISTTTTTTKRRKKRSSRSGGMHVAAKGTKRRASTGKKSASPQTTRLQQQQQGTHKAPSFNNNTTTTTASSPSISQQPPPPHITLYIISQCPPILPNSLSVSELDILLRFFCHVVLGYKGGDDAKGSGFGQSSDGIQAPSAESARKRGYQQQQSHNNNKKPSTTPQHLYLSNLALAMLIRYLEQHSLLLRRFQKFRKNEIPWYRFAIQERIDECMNLYHANGNTQHPHQQQEQFISQVWVRQLLRLKAMMALKQDVLKEERQLRKELFDNDSGLDKTDAAAQSEFTSKNNTAEENKRRSSLPFRAQVTTTPKQNPSSTQNTLPKHNMDWNFLAEALEDWFYCEVRHGRNAPLQMERELHLQAVERETELQERLESVRNEEQYDGDFPPTQLDLSNQERFLSEDSPHPYDRPFITIDHADDSSSSSSDEEYEEAQLDTQSAHSPRAIIDTQPPTLRPRKPTVKKRKKSARKSHRRTKAYYQTPREDPLLKPYISQYGGIVMDSLAIWIEDDPKNKNLTLPERLEILKSAAFANPRQTPQKYTKKRRVAKANLESPQQSLIFDFTLFSSESSNQLMRSKLYHSPQNYELVVQLRTTALPSACQLFLTPVPLHLEHNRSQSSNHVHVPEELHFEVHHQANQLSQLTAVHSRQLQAKFCDTLWDAMQYEEVIRLPFQLQQRAMRIQLRSLEHEAQARACAIREIWIVHKNNNDDEGEEVY